MASFDENGKYIKTNWKAGDKITSTKLNKIEESIEAVNDNDISRHVEADARLDALEAKDVAHDKELTNIKKTIADNKAAAELGDYDINSRMTFLEEELNEGIEEVYNVADTVDGKIAKAESDMTNAVNTAKDEMAAQVNQGKADMEAMVTEVDGKIAEAEANMTSATNAMTTQVNNAKTEMTTQVNNAKTEMTTQVNTAKANMTAQVNQGKADMEAIADTATNTMTQTEGYINKAKSDIEAQIDQAKSDLEVMKNYGAENVGKILVVGSDGRVILMNMPDVSTSGDMVAVVDKSNNIILSGDLADGTYVLKYENVDGTYSDIGTLVIGVIEPGPEPFEGNLFNLETTKLNTRFSSSGTEKDQNGVWLSDFIPFDINTHHTLYVKNAIMKRDVSSQPGPSVVFFDANKAYLSVLYCSPAHASYNNWAYKISDDYYKVVLNASEIISSSYWKNVKYIKVSGVESEAGNVMVKNDIKDVIISLNTPIEDEGTQEPTPDNPTIVEGNLFNLNTVQLNKKISGSSGSISTQNGAWLTDLIPINITEISALYVKNAMMRQDDGVAAPSPLLTFHGSDGAFLGCLRCNGAHASYQQYVEIISENYTKIDFTHTILTSSPWYSNAKYMRVNGVENPNGIAISSQNDIADVIIKINEPIE